MVINIKLLILVIVLALNSCLKTVYKGEAYNSPSAQYILQVEIGDEQNPENEHEIFFRIFDNDGSQLDIIGTKASAVMGYAVFWDTNQTITLYSSDIGVRSWLVTIDEKLLPRPVDHTLEKKAKEIFNKKMGR